MTGAELFKHIETTCNEMLDTIKKKNHDYAGLDTDPFFNFKLGEVLGIGHTEEGFLWRMSDKFSRMINGIKAELGEKAELKVKDESLKNTIVDFAAYLLLLDAFITAKKQEEEAIHDVVNSPPDFESTSTGNFGSITYASHNASITDRINNPDPSTDRITK